MKIKWIVLSVVLALACVAGAFWLLRTQPIKKASDMEITHVVPLDVLYFCYFEHADILNETLNNPQSGWSRFVSQDMPVYSFLRKLQENASKNGVASDILRSKAIYSVHPQGKNLTAPLLAIALPPSCSADQWGAIVKESGPAVNIQAYHGIYITSVGAGDTLLYAAALKDIALASSSLILLQNAIRHINSGSSLAENPQFAQVLKTAGSNSDVRLFVNSRTWNAVVTADGSSKWKKYSAVLPYLADWTALDGQVSPTVLHLSGFIFPSFSDDNYLSLLLSQSGAETTAWNTLPADASMVFNHAFVDVAGYLNGYKRFLEKHRLLAAYKKTLVALDERLQRNSEELFLSLYPEEIAAAYISGERAGWITMFKSANRKFVLEHLKALADEQKQPFAADEKNQVYHNPAQGLLAALFGELYAVSGDTFLTVKDDWIIFGDSPELLNSLAAETLSLKKYIVSTQASKYIAGNSVFSAFVVPSANNAELLSYFQPELQKNFANALQGEAFKMSGLQMRASGDKLYTTLFAVYDADEKPSKAARQPEKTDEPAAAEEPKQPEPVAEKTTRPEPAATATKQPAASAPGREKFPVVNHINKSTEYLVQTAGNKISLTAKNGAALWTKDIDGAIIDTVYQIDAYKNGKLQLLFITAGKLYLVDRNGQNVASFPVAMKPAAKHLAVFDYDKNKDYRLFVAYENNTVKAFDKKGRAVDGWKTFTAKEEITRAPEFFRVGGRDYIVVCDEKTTHLLDRKGNERITLSAPVAVKPGTAIVIQQQPPALNVTASDGKKVTISLKDGKIN